MWDHLEPKEKTRCSPLEDMAQHALRVAQVCDLLEALADDLPRRPVPVWREAAHMCNDVVRRHYKLLLDVLLPMLEDRTRGNGECDPVLLRLQSDFEEEASGLYELNALMVDAVNDRSGNIGAEALGYALRCFFGALRRNVSWEMEVLLPLATRRLNIADLNKLSRLMQADPLTRAS
ncbi:MAG: hypothetical protein AAF280_11180 [Pseudomonadota bacterium]